jgi:hypothetical protein
MGELGELGEIEGDGGGGCASQHLVLCVSLLCA